jgi:pimeloyl-ACP methyl ester carboxylesterase
MTGDYRSAIAAFVDYWNGPGSWDMMRPAVQAALTRYAPKGPLDFQAAINDPTPASAYRGLKFPVLILRGELTKLPTRLIAEGLAELMPRNRRLVLDGAGHMGPVTQASEVAALFLRHIIDADPHRQPHHAQLRSRAEMLGKVARMARAVP